MRLLVICLVTFTSLGLASSAQGFWWHHHRYCCPQQTQAVYMMPVAAAAPSSAQSGLTEAFWLKLLEKVGTSILTPPTPNQPPPVGIPNIEAKLDALSERVENVNTTLRTHGESLVGIAARLSDLDTKLSKLQERVDKIPAAGPVQLTGVTAEAVKKALAIPGPFEGTVNAIFPEASEQTSLDNVKTYLKAEVPRFTGTLKTKEDFLTTTFNTGLQTPAGAKAEQVKKAIGTRLDLLLQSGS